jgi:hypothetical protein
MPAPDVYVQFTATRGRGMEVHEAFARVPGSKIDEYRERTGDQDSNDYDLARAVCEDPVKATLGPFLYSGRVYAMGHFYWIDEPPQIKARPSDWTGRRSNDLGNVNRTQSL